MTQATELPEWWRDQLRYQLAQCRLSIANFQDIAQDAQRHARANMEKAHEIRRELGE